MLNWADNLVFGGLTLCTTEKNVWWENFEINWKAMKDTLLPCSLPVLGRKFAVRLQICPTKVFLLFMQTTKNVGFLLNQLTSRFLFFCVLFCFVFFKYNSRTFFAWLEGKRVVLLREKNNNSRHTNYDSSSPLKYTHTQKTKQNKNRNSREVFTGLFLY